MNHFNIEFIKNIRLAFRPRLWIPSLEITSILELEKVLPAHIEGLIFDVDQTIVPTGVTVVDDRFKDVLLSLHNNYKCCFLSNHRGSSAGFDRLKDIKSQTGIPFSIPTKKKPDPEAFGFALRLLGLQSDRVAMIGDRVLTDVLGGKNAGLTTVLVSPINTMTDPFLWVTLPRFLERALCRFFQYLF